MLMIGPVIPLPVSQSVLDALTDVEVTVTDVGQSGFQLRFTLSTDSALHTIFLLTGGSSLPLVRVVIVVTMNGTPHVLIDGVMTEHQILPASDAGHAVLSVSGKDLSAVMDKVDFSGFPFPAVPAEGRVALLIAKYAFLGILPMVIPSILLDITIPTGRYFSQRGTDLRYIKSLAAKVGYVFYMEPGPAPGASVAYWGPQLRLGVPQPALSINMDAHTNVESLSFKFDNDQNAIPTVAYYDETTGVAVSVPIPPVSPLSPPLGLLPPIPTKFKPVGNDLAKRSLPQSIMIGLARVASWGEAVTGTGELNVLRYGRPLKARQLVGVRGAGPAFDGLHYVKSVTHKIKRGEYKQSFKTSRNGLLSTVPRVPA
jgi:hypothetical protein